MTLVPERRGVPSALHEERAGKLTTMAILAGHTVKIDSLPDGTRPDVLQVRPMDASLFVGDAKATETPGNAETLFRLSRYASFLGRYIAAGGSGAMALIVAEEDRFGWVRLLRELTATVVGGVAMRAHVDVVERGTAIVWEAVQGSANSLHEGRFGFLDEPVAVLDECRWQP